MLPFLNSFGSVYSNTMAGSCSLERTARDPEVSRLLSVGASTPSSCGSHVEVSLLCSTGFGGPWVCMKTLSPPVPSACCAGDSPLQPGHCFPRAAAVTSPREWHQTAGYWDAPHPSSGALAGQSCCYCQCPTWALPSLQFWVGTRVPTPTVACLSERLYVFMSEILCVFIPLKYVCCS